MKCCQNFWSVILAVLVLASCRKLPEKKDYLSKNANFDKKDVYEPFMGRTALEQTNFNADGSSYPMIFTVENMRRKKDGAAAPELSEKIKVQQWIRDYDGYEKTLEEIEKKRIWSEKNFFEIRSGSGDFIFWNASSDKIRTYPDSGYVFDIKIVNKGNERVIKDFWLRPLKEVPYEPYEYNMYTRERKQETRQTPDGKSYRVPYTIHPGVIQNMYYTKDSLFTDTLVSVYIQKTGIKGHSLTFKFVDQHFNPIDPAKFGQTKWDELVHGFDRQQTTTGVTYQVAYPIPLTSLNTKYAANGKARVSFGYSRKGFGGGRVDANFGLDFAIYEPGDWTIMFFFRRDPLFEND
ncbi:DUF5007 domain-containing protein [Chitinophaga defluvii]|uniref:DUF5007 domain-containing protein n=1 Tax=Chitinophaga defluvii TaxID=3163343 RepID=A0ABV2T700_9BACT